jgi:vacuolar-type H+-ATPase subunit E/Vma4
MELNKICDRIINDAKLEAEGIINDAKEKAIQIINDETQNQIDKGEEIKQKGKKNAQNIFERSVSNASFHANQSILIAKRKLIEKVFSKVLQKLNNLSKEELEAFIRMKTEGIYGKAIFIFDNNLTNKISDEFLKSINPEFSLSKEHCENGFKIVQEKTELNFDFSEMVDRLKEEYDTVVANALFD